MDHLRELAQIVDCFLPSLEHVRYLFGTDDSANPARLEAHVNSFGCPLTVVKCGRSGVVIFGPDNPQGFAVPAVPSIEVADPTGAGDGFNGGFLIGLARGEHPTLAAVTGSVAASFVVQAVGVAVPAVFSGRERAARYRQSCMVDR